MAVDQSKKPYYNDFRPEKKYYSVLFQPSRPVQVRELNQLQSIFENQVSTLGSHIFKEGSQVLNGETSYNLNSAYVTVDIDHFNTIKTELGGANLKLTGEFGGVEAEVINFIPAEDNDPHTFYVRYTQGGNRGSNKVFDVKEQLTITRNGKTITQAVVKGIGTGSRFSVESGVFFVGGRFVLNDAQSVMLNKYSSEPSVVVGFVVEENVVTAGQDASLYDNSIGTSNASSPGADRLYIDLNLQKFPLLDDPDAMSLPKNFVEIFRIRRGEVQNQVVNSAYSNLEDTLARRTADSDGDFTVQKFNIQIKEHLNNGVNGGVYTKDQGGNLGKFIASLSPGKAYVEGYEINTRATKNISVDKVLDDKRETMAFSIPMGTYVEISPGVVEAIGGFSRFDDFAALNFFDKTKDDETREPYARARVQTVTCNAGGQARLYLFDVQFVDKNKTIKNLENAVSISGYRRSDRTWSWAYNVSGNISVVAKDSNNLLYKLPIENVRTLTDDSGNANLTMTTLRNFTTTIPNSGMVLLEAGNNETFIGQDPSTTTGMIIDSSGQWSSNDWVDVSKIMTLSGTPFGKTATINVGAKFAGRQFSVNMALNREKTTPKTKITTKSSIERVLSKEGQMSLNISDAISVESIVDSKGVDVKSLFTLYPNKKPSFYDVSYVALNSPSADIGSRGPFKIEFTYYDHTAGDYFTVDSYSDTSYYNIPVENGLRLSDAIDFRPRIDSIGEGFTAYGANKSVIPMPYSLLRTSISRFLPRNDLIYLQSNGEFSVARGVQSENPVTPDAPLHSMPLYELLIPAYVSDVGQIRCKSVSTRRWTHKDIDALGQRMTRIEDVVSLSLLESTTRDTVVVDPKTGQSRFKNGFLVDGFQEHAAGDYGDPQYRCSVGDGELRPEFSLNATDMEFDEANSQGVVNNNGFVTLAFTENVLIDQTTRTGAVNVNMYPGGHFFPSFIMSPNSDSWIDTVYSEPTVAFREHNNGNLNQGWNSWQNYWTSASKEIGAAAQDELGYNQAKRNSDVVNGRLISNNVTPFMRSVVVEVKGIAHKPNTRLNFFFDNINVNAYVKPNGPQGLYGTPIVTNEDGAFDVFFKIPNDKNLKFTTGAKSLVITDGNTTRVADSLSFSEEQFTAAGCTPQRDNTIVSTRHTSSPRTTEWISAVGQSFLAKSFGDDFGGVNTDSGVFLTRAELFFRKKDTVYPVTVDIREMDNGYPTQRIVPGTKVTLHPSQVKTSSDGTAPTSFNFQHPIYLREGCEYCIIVTTTSNKYEVFWSTLGDHDLITGRFISEQPYIGVMFKSQNSSTFTEDQNSDLQFRLYNAKFDARKEAFVELTSKTPEKLLIKENGLRSTANSDVVYIDIPRHNFFEGARISIENAETVGDANLTNSDINGTFDVVDASHMDRVGFRIGKAAEKTANFGGGMILSTVIYQASLVNPNVTSMNFPETTITTAIRGTIGKSTSGNETTYADSGTWVPVQNNEAHYLTQPYVVLGKDEETSKLKGKKSLRMRINMTTSNDNITPVVDLQRTSIILPYFLINDAGTKTAAGEETHAKYITRPSPLATPSSAIRVFLESMIPDGADVVISGRFGRSAEDIVDRPWIEIPRDAVSAVSLGFEEHVYAIEESSHKVDGYTFFQIMIQLKSKSNTRVPVCRKLRVIALGT